MENLSKMFLFDMDDEKYAMPVGEIYQITKYEKVTPMVGSEKYIKGIVKIFDDIVTVIDLRYLLSKRSTILDSNTDNFHFLLLNDKKRAFIIESLNKIVDIIPENVQSIDLNGVPHNQVLNLDGEIYSILNSDNFEILNV